MIYFGITNTYYNNADNFNNPLVSPLFSSNLRHLPPAFIITAEYDTLRNEAHAYANKLKSAGNEVTYKKFPEMVHGFMGMFALVPAEVKQAMLMIKDHLDTH